MQKLLRCALLLSPLAATDGFVEATGSVQITGLENTYPA